MIWTVILRAAYAIGDLSQKIKQFPAVESSIAALDNFLPDAWKKLAKVPIMIVIGAHAQDRVAAARKFQKGMAVLERRLTVDGLPEAGIHSIAVN